MSGCDRDFLPEDKLPDWWKDEASCNVLFAPFRNRSVNRREWDSKFLIWRNLISLYCTHNQEYVFKPSDLSKKFVRNGRAPACLNVVIEVMSKVGDIQPLHTFLQKPTESWSSWAADVFLKKPLIWSFNKVKNTVIAPNSDIAYVHLEAVHVSAGRIFSNVPEHVKNKVVNLQGLACEINMDVTKLETLSIILHYLSSQRKVAIREICNSTETSCTLIKFCENNPITDADVDLYTLEQSEKSLTSNIEKMENEVEQLITDAKAYLIKGRKQSAKNCLRKKREIEKCIEKRANMLHNVQILLARVQDASTDSKVLKSYKKALSSLQRTFSESDLNEESVSKTMLELEKVIDIHNDIQSALSQTNLTTDSDLEEELNELIAPKNEEGEASQQDDMNLDDLEKKLKLLDINLPTPSSTKAMERQKKVSL